MPLSRRELLKGFGSVATALGLGPLGYQHFVPYVHQPENIVPGVPTWFATSCRECPAGCGMIVRNNFSRITKADGNPAHPISHGKLCPRGQASLHGLYDPDRIPRPSRRNSRGAFTRTTWKEALDAVGSVLANRGRIAFVSSLETDSLAALMRAWLTALGSDRMLIYEPIDYAQVKAASRAAVGRPIVPLFNIAGSDYLISFAADFLGTWISPVHYAVQFAQMRQVRNGTRGRYVYVGPRISQSAVPADQQIIVPAGTEAMVAQALIHELRGGAGPYTADSVARQLHLRTEEIRTVAAGLRRAKAPLALPGGDTDTAISAMQLNGAMGSALVDFGTPHALSGTASHDDMRALISDMENGRIDVLVVHGANPVYSLPEGARFAKAMKRVKTVISLSSYADETTANAHWVLPSSTPLESWGDYTPQPGITNLMQPTMGLLFDTRQTGDILIELARAAGLDPMAVFKTDNFYNYLRARWGFPMAPGQMPDTVNTGWEALVQAGGRWTTPTPAGTAVPAASAGSMTLAPPKADEIRLWAYPNLYLYDGRGANRRWLQEMGEPVARGAWSTWVEMHPTTARKLGVRNFDVVQVSHGGAKLEAPAYVWAGVQPATVAIPIGQGHTAYGRYAKGTGSNVWPLLDTEHPVVTVKKTGRRTPIPRWQLNEFAHGREIALTTPLGKQAERGEIAMPLPEGYGRTDFYPGNEYPAHRWAMIVDMDRCIGCNACVVACYAENNVAVVGAEGIYRSRKMAWLRIDQYTDWRAHTPIVFQPMLCQHCDTAPCEPVCPVYAAVHDREGLNEQVYNRCVGTRYCSNNCPYKVRRFNWFHYEFPRPLNYQLNPQVTVRDRGVMEKCTFCVQRIREAEILAKREGRPLRDGEIVTACQQACPTGVFTFGDLLDPNSRVSKIARNDPRAYQVLQELNTKPAVFYLKRIVESI